MTIRLAPATPYTIQNRGEARTVNACGTVLALADTAEEAEQAKRAFEQVLAPRFTRDEAIALCWHPAHAIKPEDFLIADRPWARGYVAGVRAALEALAAAGVFSDGRDMADKLDAAGIR